jgi:hypothetical protein
MAGLNTVALGIGWVVIGVGAVIVLDKAWWGAGELVWRALPEGWWAAQKIPVPQPQYGAYISPAVSRKALALMFVLGGPRGWLRFPHMLAVNREKYRIIAADQPHSGEPTRG